MNNYYDTCTTTLKSRYMYHNNEKYMYTRTCTVYLSCLSR